MGPGLSYTVTRGIVSGLRYTGAAFGIVSAKIVSIGIEGVAFATDVLDALRSIGIRITYADS